jgi:uncharacterized membrane protein YfcA
MMADPTFLLALPIFAAAILYSSVGHAGASGYLAVMSLYGLAPQAMRPAALVLNILVALIATVRFYRAGCFSWGRFWPFAAGSIPLAFVGGALTLPSHYYKPIVGVVLAFAALRLLVQKPVQLDSVKPVPIAPAIIFGAGIGLLSGLTGVGGGIFLSPLLLFMGWAAIRQASGTSAAFILVNSISGLIGGLGGIQYLPGATPVWAVAAVLGGFVGTELGARRLNSLMLRRLLSVVLVIAALKLTLT